MRVGQMDNNSKNCCKNTGLKILFTVHRLTGLSFFGASLPSEHLSFVSQCALIALNIAVFVFSYYTFYISVVHDRAEPGSGVGSLENSTARAFLGDRHAMTPLIAYLRVSALAIYHLFGYIINVYLGAIARPFLAILAAEVLPRLDHQVEQRIGLLITVVEVCVIALMICLLQALVFIKFGHFMQIRALEVVLNMFSLFAPIALIAYLNLAVAHLIVTSTDTHKANLSVYIERLLQVGSIMKRTTRLLGPAIIVLIINSMVVCICTVCLFIADWATTFFISTWGFLIYALVLISLVMVSSYAYETSKATSDQFKQELLLALCNYKPLCLETGRGSSGCGKTCAPNGTAAALALPISETHLDAHLISSQLTILSSLEENIRMAPLNLFYLTRSYILTFLAFMLSYSVILIQTSKSSITDVDFVMKSCNNT